MAKTTYMKLKMLNLLCMILINTVIMAQSVLDQSNVGTSPTRSLVDNIQNCLQTFVPSVSGQLTEVKVEIQTENCPYALICKIFEDTLGANVLATELVTVPINTQRSMQTITFANPPVLSAGTSYTIALYANCISGPGLSIWWYKSVDDAYNFGQAYNQWGTTIQSEDTLNDFYFQTYMSISSGFEENEGDFVKISPIPADQFISIQLMNSDAAKYELIEASGRKVLSGICNSDMSLSLDHLDNGLYFMFFKLGEKIVTKRIIIDHYK